MKGYVIDSEKRTITEVEYGYSDIGRYLKTGKDSFCLGWRFKTGDILYVDDRGMFKPQAHFFWIDERTDQPLAGNGFVHGPDDPITEASGDPILTIDELRSKIRFVDRAEADKWAAGIVHRGGTSVNGIVIMTLKELFANIPRPEGLVVTPEAPKPLRADDAWWAYLEEHKAAIQKAIQSYAPMFVNSGMWDQALTEKQVQKILSILEATWIAAPENRRIYQQEGFNQLCALLEGDVGTVGR